MPDPNRSRPHRQPQHVKLPPGMPDFMTAALSFAGVNLLWIFLVIWVLYGMMPVLLLALVINHLITRLDQHLQDQH